MHDSIAVIIPTHNRRHTLARALESVLAQTRPADEIWIIDDGSDDGSGELLSRDYPMVNYLFQDNRGVSAARNLGADQAGSRWLAFLDSDDAWLPHKLERQLEASHKNARVPLIHCDEIWIRRGQRVNPMRKHAKTGGWIFERCLPLCVISPSAAMIERECFVELGGFDESLPACEDYDLWLRLCSRYPVHYIDEPLLKKYGGHDDQLSRRYWGMDRFRVQSLRRLLEEGDLSPRQRRAARATLIEKARILAAGAEKHDNPALLGDMRALLAEQGAGMDSDSPSVPGVSCSI